VNAHAPLMLISFQLYKKMSCIRESVPLTFGMLLDTCRALQAGTESSTTDREGVLLLCKIFGPSHG
jgi:hypothetical protein